ncbi:hypothetical protein PIB30_115329, partial [Stylosanthes scabra]|nr:hypothetical protein [Stylosanthes scabra]
MVVNTATQRSTTLEGKRHGMGKEEGWISTEASVVVEKEGVTMQLFVRRWQDVGTVAMAAPVVVGKIWRQQGELGKGETWFLEKEEEGIMLTPMLKLDLPSISQAQFQLTLGPSDLQHYIF